MKPQGETNFYKSSAPDTTSSAGADNPPKPAPAKTVMAWTASEYVEHQRGASWYASLVAITAVITAAVYFITKDYFATGTIVLVGLIVGITVGRKPGQMNFELSASGLQAGPKSYSYNLFKSFSIIKEGNLISLSLTPVKRFMPPVSAYFDPKDEQKIVSVVGERLPYEERQPSAIDRLSFRLRI